MVLDGVCSLCMFDMTDGMGSAGLKWPRHTLRAEEVIIWSTGQSTLWRGGGGGLSTEVGFISNSEFLQWYVSLTR